MLSPIFRLPPGPRTVAVRGHIVGESPDGLFPGVRTLALVPLATAVALFLSVVPTASAWTAPDEIEALLFIKRALTPRSPEWAGEFQSWVCPTDVITGNCDPCGGDPQPPSEGGTAAWGSVPHGNWKVRRVEQSRGTGPRPWVSPLDRHAPTPAPVHLLPWP